MLLHGTIIVSNKDGSKNVMRNVRPVFGCVTQHIQPPSFGLVHSVIVIYSMSQLSHAVWMTIIGPPCEQANRFVKSSCFRACKTCTYRDISRSTRQKCFGRNMWCEHNILSVGTVKRNRKFYTPLMFGFEKDSSINNSRACFLQKALCW